MKINKQRRQFLIFSSLALPSIYISGCGSNSGSNSSATNISSTLKPKISRHPIDQTVVEGKIATFNVIATGEGLSYQWFKNSTNIPNEINSVYSTPPTTLDDDGSTYIVVVTNQNGNISSNQAILFVKKRSITADSLNYTVDSTSITTDRN